ncbi:MAG: homoserine kinase [Bacteroidia bacterium]|nr:homoserine kinase [Bacteroidia bacterium]
MNFIKLKSPATTANVGPGYDIFAMSLGEPYDEFIITLNNTDVIKIDIYGETQNIPASLNDNTAGLAILELFKRKNITQGLTFEINKKMPSGCGLGTTGASASAAIFGLNKLLNLNLGLNELVDIARYGEIASGGSPHADNVAAALMGGFVLIKNYHPIDVIKLEMPEIPVVLAVIRKSQRTTRGFITYEIGQEKLKEQMARCSSVIHAIHTRDIKEFGRAISVDHIAEPVRGAVIPEYIETKLKLLQTGAYGCNISGGGSSVFCICEAEKQDELADIMQKNFKNNSNFIRVIKTKTSNKGVFEVI